VNTAFDETRIARSPLSARPPEQIRILPKTYLLEQLALYYGEKPSEQIVESDYSLWRCVETGLQFCWPMLPGNTVFYEWISGFTSYYPGMRWEYAEVRRHLMGDNLPNGESSNVLDVGCGTGDFLSSMSAIPAECRFALDLNKPAVEACRQKGFQAFCGTVETAIESGFLKAAQFSVVTSFHCLEHVQDPVGFARELLKMLLPGGRLYVSTPYSPMSFESDWFDIMNHPPHHMTRWNLTAYQRLAEILGAKMRYFVPHFRPAKSALDIFRLKQYGPHRFAGKVALIKDLVRRTPLLVRLYQEQKQRARTSPVGGADVILVEFTLA
jgi:SAM-dependent methyltransferase